MQNLPNKGIQQVTPEVVRDIEERARIGALKYGSLLETFNGRSALQDLYEELLDAAQYTKQAIMESESSESFISSFEKMAIKAYKINVLNGFWEEKRSAEEVMAMIRSELSRASRPKRKSSRLDCVSGFTSAEEELADVVIQIMNVSAGMDLRVADAVVAKLESGKARGCEHSKSF